MSEIPADSEVIRRYEDLVRTRRRDVSTNPLIPPARPVDWGDAPSRYKIYLELARVPLSASLHCGQLELGIRPTRAPMPGGISFEEISDFLQLTCGILQRKLTVNWNADAPMLAWHKKALYARGAASGGGLYPWEVYLIPRGAPSLVPGVYHYSVGQHALSRIRVGNFDPILSSAVNCQEAETADFLFVVTVRFWKNVFKYHNLGYQLAIQDVGTLLGLMEQVAYSLGWNMTIIYWFRDQLLASLLGLGLDEEPPFVVVAAKRDIPAECGNGPGPSLSRAEEALPPPPIHTRIFERSRNTFLPEMLLQVHSHTLLEMVSRPTLLPLSPPPDRERIRSTSQTPSHVVTGSLRTVLRNRESSSGRFRMEPAIELHELEAILSFSVNGSSYRTDLYEGPTPLPSLSLVVLARNVRQLREGVYSYCFPTSQLTERTVSPLPASLQSIYFLGNYNLDQISALLVVMGKLDEVLATFGARGMRIMNVEAGILAQRAYLASAARSLGCGVALGFDAQQIAQIIDSNSSAEIPLLLIFLGRQVENASAFAFHLVEF